MCLCVCVSGSLVCGTVSVILEEISPVLCMAGIQEVQQEDSSRECGLTNVSVVL